MQKYLTSTTTIDCETPTIVEKAFELTKKHNLIEDKAKAIFYFVRDEIKYRIPYAMPKIDGFIASRILQQKESFCIPKAILLTALARACRIHARIHFADIRNFLLPKSVLDAIGTDVMIYHGYTELFLQNKWIKVNPAFDIDLCKKHDFMPVEFSGSSDALFQLYDRKGRVHFEYLKDHGHYADFNEKLYHRVVSTIEEYYGAQATHFVKDMRE